MSPRWRHLDERSTYPYAPGALFSNNIQAALGPVS